MTTGGCGCCTGLGHDQLGENVTNSPSKPASSSVHISLMARIVLPHHVPPAGRVDAVVLHLLVVPADADPEQEAAAGQVVERGDLPWPARSGRAGPRGRCRWPSFSRS